MPKESGITATIAVDDHLGAVKTISEEVSDWSFSTPRNPQDVTGGNQSAIERLLLLADFSCTLSGQAFNDASDKSHDVFKTVPSTSVARTTTITISAQVMENEVFYTDYALTRGQDGSLGWSAPGVLAGGVVPTWA